MKIKIKGLMTREKEVKPTIRVIDVMSKVQLALLEAEDIEDMAPAEQIAMANKATNISVEFLTDVFGIDKEKILDLTQDELGEAVGYATMRLSGLSDKQIQLSKDKAAAVESQNASEPQE